MHALIDISNASKAAFHVNKDKRSPSGLQSGTAVNLLQQIRKVVVDYHVSKVSVLYDSHPTWREDYYPSYKLARRIKNEQRRQEEKINPPEHDFYQQFLLAVAVIKLLPISEIQGDGLEADDLAGAFCSDGPTLLVSNDFDWCQLVTPSCSVYQTKFKRLITLENFTKELGYNSPLELIDMSSLCGDDGDGIPGAAGVGEKTALKYLRGLMNKKTSTHKKIQEWINDPEGMTRSRHLFSLENTPPELLKSVRVVENRLQEQAFLELAKELNWGTVLNDPQRWLAPFYQLTVPE